MAIRIDPSQVQNRQTIEAGVAGPDGANRLFIVTGQFDASVGVFSQSNSQTQQTQTFTVLVGPVLTRQQFIKASGTASIAKTTMGILQVPANPSWLMVSVDADWDDESGQVEVRIEVSVAMSGNNNSNFIQGMMFQATILAAVAQ